MYFWLKILHVSAMVLWFAGLFFLPRLFVARHRGERDGAASYFNVAANTVFFRVATPAALVAVASGMVLIAFGPTGAWLVMKLVVVTCAVLLHLYMGMVLYELGQGRERHGPALYRLLGWAPLFIVLAVAGLTGAKPETVGDLPPPPSAGAER
ncbi:MULTISPECIES: CopD family protein [unclassified Luteimonas]